MSLYNTILNPETGKQVSIYGKLGQRVLSKFIEVHQYGGVSFVEGGGDDATPTEEGGASVVEGKGCGDDTTPTEEGGEDDGEEEDGSANGQINQLIKKAGGKPINYWAYYIDKSKYGVKRYETYDDHEFSYKDDSFKIVTSDQILAIVTIVTQLYTELHRLRPSTTRILKYTVGENAEIAYFGDYHSSLHALIESLQDLRTRNFFEDETWQLRDNKYLVFMGDLVDRGPYGVECLYLLYLLFAINNQEEYRVFLLKGNHEESSTYAGGGFGDELKNKLADSASAQTAFEKLITLLPLAVFIQKEDAPWYQFCHGGISIYHTNGILNRFLVKPRSSVLDLPNNEQYGGDRNGFIWADFTSNPGNTTRLASSRRVYPRDITNSITRDNNIRTIISGHQDMTNLGLVERPDIEDGEYDKDDILVWDEYYSKRSGPPLKDGTPLKTLRALRGEFLTKNVEPVGDEMVINMEHYSAIVMSSSTIAKMVPFSIYGILSMANDTSLIIWKPSCNTTNLLKNPVNKYNDANGTNNWRCSGR